MDEVLEFKKNKEKYEVRVYYKRRNSTSYYNIFGKDATQIAQVLLDLELISGFPVDKAVQIYRRRKNKGDWLGL